jgi:hypothetical protein
VWNPKRVLLLGLGFVVFTAGYTVNGLIVDWQRFVTHQTLDFMREEIRPIRTVCPDLPVTTNMHGLFPVDYFKFKGDIDFASYDAYPTWDSVPDAETADLRPSITTTSARSRARPGRSWSRRPP